jgi:5-methyltetrahydrofolate corrinoid/iron sulfur protein methyltransferase
VKIVGEKINGTRKSVGRAIAERDAAFIQNLAKKQAEGGAHWLDVNAGTPPDQEPTDLAWLVQVVQDVVDIPLCLDSANPAALRHAIKEVKTTPMINSISGETNRLEGVLPVAAEFGCELIALAADDNGIPTTPEARMVVVRQLFEAMRAAGIADERVYVDPLTMMIATDTNSGRVTLDTIRAIRDEFPKAHVVLGVSNASFGLPVRAAINRIFLVLALAAGMDTALIDPNDRELKAAMLTAEMLLGYDKHCANYVRSYRKGLLESKPQ